ncbi:unnamed protein product [Brachionus calyciflorus]|uniref:ESF1 n=1 Tax=Brachionus calyciflorus TaxID=104777 RepID=A0A814BX86_9BILA|nr:unnamed protein product [Brachionus calyciflorus]
MDEIIKDERFKHIVKDSRFRQMPKHERKFKVDKRFKNMFEDNKFKIKYSVDKRGRPVNLTSSDNLKKFYDLSSEEEDEESDEDKKEESKTESETESESDESESSLSEQEQEAEPIPWNELDADTIREDKTSHRLALCNMDWDRIKAQDLFVLLNSFKPAQGVIKSIKIYLSQYGKERMEYEKMHGPVELTQNENLNESGDSELSDDEDEGRKFDRRQLRIYQFNRLKYFYAVIECDTAETADKIYTECDGLEYESSSTRLDLRFVPDDTEFDDSDLKDSCTEAPDPITYKPNLFVTTALNQTKVECTWDETPKDRLAITMKKYTEEDLKNSDFKNLIATSSDEDSEAEEDLDEKKKVDVKNDDVSDEEENRIKKYKELLLGVEKKSRKNRECDLEFDWDGGIRNSSSDEDEDKFKKKRGQKKINKIELSEEDKKERARLSLLTMDDEDQKEHFNLDDLLLDKKQRRNKKKSKYDDEDVDEKEKKQDNFQVNIKDPRFQAIFTDHKFNIDPSDQLFKKTKAMENILNEKIKRIESGEVGNEDKSNLDEDKNNSNGVSLLVKSIKSKTESLKRKKETDNKFSKNKKKFA